MAELNAVHYPEYAELLKRTLRLEESPGIPVLSPELQAVLALEVDPPEWALLRGVVRYAAVPLSVGVAANNSGIQLSLAPNTNTIAVIDYAAVVQSATQVSLRRNSTQRSGGSRALPTDTRSPSAQASAVTIETIQAGATEGSAIDTAFPPAATGPQTRYGVVEKGLVLAPGQNYMFWGELQNQGILIVVSWYERSVRAEELPPI